MAYNYPKQRILLSSQTASNSASLTFTSLINSNFSVYALSVRDYSPATTNTILVMTFSSNNGSTYLSTNYSYSVNFLVTNNNGNSRSSSSANIFLAPNISSTTANSLNGDWILYDFNTNIYNPKVFGQSVYVNNGPANASAFSCGTNTTGSAINAIKLASSSGNLASGTFNFYGIVEA